MEGYTNYFDSLQAYNRELKVAYAEYLNRRVEFQAFHPKKKEENEDDYNRRLTNDVSDDERVANSRAVSNFRLITTFVKIEINSLKDKIPNQEKVELINSSYEKITFTEPPSINDCLVFVQNVNDLIVQIINAPSVLNAKKRMDDLARINQ